MGRRGQIWWPGLPRKREAKTAKNGKQTSVYTVNETLGNITGNQHSDIIVSV